MDTSEVIPRYTVYESRAEPGEQLQLALLASLQPRGHCRNIPLTF